MSYAVGQWVYNTRTGEYGIITSSGGFMPMPGALPDHGYTHIPRIDFPPGDTSGTVEISKPVSKVPKSQPSIWGGLDPMGAGIAGVNTPARKVGRATKESAKAKRKQTNLNKKINEKLINLGTDSSKLEKGTYVVSKGVGTDSELTSIYILGEDENGVREWQQVNFEGGINEEGQFDPNAIFRHVVGAKYSDIKDNETQIKLNDKRDAIPEKGDTIIDQDGNIWVVKE